MLSNLQLLNSDKTEGLLQGPQSARNKLPACVAILKGLAVTSCASVKDPDVIY